MVGDVVIVTDDILRRGMSSRGGWTDRQMALLGVDRRNNSGWKAKLIGSRVPAAAVEEFLSLRNAHLLAPMDLSDFGRAKEAAEEMLLHCDRLMADEPGEEAAAVIENTRMVCNAFLDLLDERNRPADGRGRFKRANKRRPRD